MPSGGDHPPVSPAQVSGPGALSQRTDSKQPVRPLTGGDYGSNQESVALQSSAPMGAPSAGPGGALMGDQPAVQPPTGMGAPSERPGEPVTAGAGRGAGPGQEALGLPAAPGSTQAEIRAKYGPILPSLIAEASSQFATQEFKDSVRSLISLI